MDSTTQFDTKTLTSLKYSIAMLQRLQQEDGGNGCIEISDRLRFEKVATYVSINCHVLVYDTDEQTDTVICKATVATMNKATVASRFVTPPHTHTPDLRIK